MNEDALATSGQLATSDPSAFEALISTGIIGLDEVRAMPLGTRVMLHDGLREFFWTRAEKMSQSPGCPAHLKNDPETAFAVVRMALNWNMDYFSVAQSTFSPAVGKIGIEGKLAVGAMMGSRKVKSIKYDHRGEWDAIAGKFKMEQSKYKDGNTRMKDGQPVLKAVATYTAEDELGLYVIATATMHDDSEVSTPEVHMNACHPRNSTLWAANPRRQIMYVADRMLFQISCADILMGVHFDVGLDEVPAEPIDITPPKSVDLAAEGVKGTDTTEPMTEAGVVDLETGEILEEKKATPSAIVDKGPTARRPRVKLMFDGKEVYQTGFINDVKKMLDTVNTWEGLEDLQATIRVAIATVGNAGAEKKITDQINPMIEAVQKEFETEEPAQEEPLITKHALDPVAEQDGELDLA